MGQVFLINGKTKVYYRAVSRKVISRECRSSLSSQLHSKPFESFISREYIRIISHTFDHRMNYRKERATLFRSSSFPCL